MSYLKRFGMFWWDFVVGDDWLVAAGIVVALALTWILSHHDVSAWWVMPVAAALLLVTSLRRATRGER